MDCSAPTVYIVGNDASVASTTIALTTALAVPSKLFDSAEVFLEFCLPELVGCLLVDIHLTRMGGIELLEALASRGSLLPVILVGTHADVPTTVRAMRSGALTVLEKPCNVDALADAIRAGFLLNAKARAATAQSDEARRRVESLTPEERRLVTMILEGHPNKVIAQEFGSCRRTVERMRARVFQKMGVTSAVQLPAIMFRVEEAHSGVEAVGRPAFGRLSPRACPST